MCQCHDVSRKAYVPVKSIRNKCRDLVFVDVGVSARGTVSIGRNKISERVLTKNPFLLRRSPTFLSFWSAGQY